MRKYLLSALFAASLSIACSTPVESVCSKAKECGELGEQTEEQCVAELSEAFDELRAEKKSSCDKIADAYEDYFSCLAGLSCDDLKSDASSTECKQAQKDFESVFAANIEDCGVEG